VKREMAEEEKKALLWCCLVNKRLDHAPSHACAREASRAMRDRGCTLHAPIGSDNVSHRDALADPHVRILARVRCVD
jgi:hypothetical protein